MSCWIVGMCGPVKFFSSSFDRQCTGSPVSTPGPLLEGNAFIRDRDTFAEPGNHTSEDQGETRILPTKIGQRPKNRSAVIRSQAV